MRTVACRVLLILIAAAVWSVPAWAQTPYTELHFGLHAGMRFDTSFVPTAIRGPVLTEEGAATWCDPASGEVLISTDGRTVYNRLGKAMPLGQWLLGGGSSTQSVAILPMPGSDGRWFYIFTVEELSTSRPSTLRMSTVDMTLDSGRGDIVTKNIILASSVGEKLTLIPHCDGRTWWLLTHHAFKARFEAIRVTDVGFTDTRISTFPTDRSPLRNPLTGAYGRGMLMPSPQADKLAMASTDANTLELYDFDNETGEVTNRRILHGGDDYYGVMFSPSGKVLYATTWYDVYTVDLHDLSALRPPQKLGAIPSARFGSVFRGGITMGPDRKIYIAAGDAVMGIPNPDGGALASGYGSVRIPLLDGTATSVGMPNVTMDVVVPAARSCAPPRPLIDFDTVICAGECVTFTDRSLNRPTTWEWAFDDGSIPTYQGQQPPPICYRFPGIYRVRLRVTNDYGVDSTVRTIRVAFRPNIDAGDNVLACSGAGVVLRATGADQYRWSPASGLDDSTSATPAVAAGISGWFTVVATTVDGCVGTDSVFVRQESFANVPLTDTVICAGATLRFPMVDADSVLWSPANDLANPRAIDQWFTGSASQSYTVRIWRGPCDTTLSVAVRVVPSGSDTIELGTMCSGDTIRLQAPDGLAYRWQDLPGGGMSLEHSVDVVTPSGFHRVAVEVELDGGCRTARVFEWTASPPITHTPVLTVQRHLQAGVVDTITVTVPGGAPMADALLTLEVPSALFSTVVAALGSIVADVQAPGSGVRHFTLRPVPSGVDAVVTLYAHTMLMPAEEVRFSVGGTTEMPCRMIQPSSGQELALDGCYHVGRVVAFAPPATVAVAGTVPLTVDVRGRPGTDVTIDVWSVHGTLLCRREVVLTDEHMLLSLEGCTAPPACIVQWRVGAELGIVPLLLR